MANIKALAFFALCLIVGASASQLLGHHVPIVNHANKGWRAGYNKFSAKTQAEVKHLMGAIQLGTLKEFSFEQPPAEMMAEFGDLPDNFDSRQAWGSCVHPILDQAHCGSCWAFSASETLSDRFCIHSNGTVDVVLAPQDLVSCDKTNMGCNGGILPLAWHYMKDSGVVSMDCDPYTSADGTTGSCAIDGGKCPSGDAYIKYHASDFQHVGTSLFIIHSEAKIRQEIFENGPVQAAFSVYEDFMSYSSGVYSHVTGNLLGGHAIKIVGWGVTTDSSATPYWIVANSWGPDWGINGFFWIKRGTNECGIEADVYAGLPLIQ